MVSTESKVQAVAAVVALAVLAVGASLLDLSLWWTQPLLVGVFESIVFGGAHLYFVVRGGGGELSLTARRRFLWVLVAFLALVPLTVFVGDATIGPVAARRLLMRALGGIAVIYLVLEGVAGYRTTTTPD